MDLEENMTLLNNCLTDFYSKRDTFDAMYRYGVVGVSDGRLNYKNNPARSNLKVKANFIKKFIKEEVSYLLSNKPTLASKSGNHEIIDYIEGKTAHWSESHDKDLLRDMLTFGTAFELYYTKTVPKGDKNEILFCSKVISPRDGYAYFDDNLEMKFFMRFYKKKFDSTQYIDIYTKDKIYHCDSSFNQIKEPDVHYFGMVPVTQVKISKYKEHDTLFNDIKDLQDAFETNLSDIVNEISDYRLAYFLALGCKLDVEVIASMKSKGIINSEEKDVIMKFLTKDINDTFVQNTLTTLKENLYELSNHINVNEKLSSNLSGVALRNRLIGLEQRVRDSESALKDMHRNRVFCMFSLFYKLEKINFDYRDVTVKYTLNIPQDDLSVAQMLSQVPEGIISKDTARAQFSFISNTRNEAEKVKQEEIEGIQDINLDHV